MFSANYPGQQSSSMVFSVTFTINNTELNGLPRVSWHCYQPRNHFVQVWHFAAMKWLLFTNLRDQSTIWNAIMYHYKSFPNLCKTRYNFARNVSELYKMWASPFLTLGWLIFPSIEKILWKTYCIVSLVHDKCSICFKETKWDRDLGLSTKRSDSIGELSAIVCTATTFFDSPDKFSATTELALDRPVFETLLLNLSRSRP